MSEQKNIKTCLLCDEPLRGRKDQLYCSTQCRIEHHNHMNRDTSKFMTNINNLLRKNHRILQRINREGTTKIAKVTLLDEGFNFNYFTNEYVTRNGKVYRFVYDQGYLALENGIFAIVHKHEYVD